MLLPELSLSCLHIPRSYSLTISGAYDVGTVIILPLKIRQATGSSVRTVMILSLNSKQDS